MGRTVGPSLAPSFEPLECCRNLVSLSLFYRYYFGRCLSELAQLAPFPYAQGRSTCYSDPRCYEDVYINSFFSAQLDSGKSLSKKFFP